MSNLIYSNFRCLGCLSFFSILSSHRGKFEARVVPCVFLGYTHGKTGYKVLNQKILKPFISTNLVFHEELFPFASIKAANPVVSFLLNTN